MNYFRCGGGRSTHTATKIDVAKTPLATFESNVSGLYIPEILAYIQATQTGTGDPSPSNPRAINGVSSVDTTRTGKNLSTAPLVYATATSSTQVTEDGKSCTRFTCAVTTTYTGVRFKPNTQYTVKFNAKTVKSGTPTVNSGAFVFNYSDNTCSIKYVGKEDTTWTDYTLTSTAGKTVVSIGTLSTDWRLLVYVDNDTFQLEEGNTATPYETYTGQTATTALGMTCYGGYLNLETGLLTVTHAIVDLGSLTWTYRSGNKLFTAFKSGIKLSSDAKGTPCLCDIYKATYGGSWSGWANFPNEHISSGNNYSAGDANIAVKDLRFTDKDTFKTAMSGVYLVYELATPQTVQLTPAQIEQLLGQNNVFCSSGDVSVKHWKID